jgi:uncharacterized protein YaaN involved in tellurite resistance
LDVDQLKVAFSNLDAALNDISNFRRNALPQMAESIVEMDDLTKKMDTSIQNMESGNAVAEKMEDDLGLLIIDENT